MKRRSNESFSFEKNYKKTSRKPGADPEEPADFEDADEHRSRRSKTRDYRKASALARAESFRCKKCRAMIGAPPSGGLQRNHCPLCLYSMHIDNRPGDRSANCGSSMEPISIWVRDREWVLLHRCMGCGVIHSNRIAADDNEIALMSLAAKPLARPAFPLYQERGSDP
ncbi:MAG: RNHCP domain-containing protein [Leptospirales bacterium]|jgi:hypothetical protein